MICSSCGKNNYADAPYCTGCSSSLMSQPASGGPMPPISGAYPGGGASVPTVMSRSRFPNITLRDQDGHIHYPTWFLVACGGMIFAITVVAILIMSATWRAAQAPSSAIVVVPDNSGAQAIVKNDPNMLLLRKPGDSWTYSFTRDSVDGLGKETIESGQNVVKTGRLVKHDKTLIVDTAVMTFSQQGAPTQTRTYVSYALQKANRSLYQLGYSDDSPDKIHYNSTPELMDKGDWSQNPSFDINTETETGAHSHTYVTVQPEPVTMSLSNGSHVTCWNRTVSVVADEYNETDTDVYCPAIGATISSTADITYPNGAKRTTTTNLTHFSLAN